MGREILSRVFSVAVVMWGVSLVTYGLIYLSPGSPAYMVLKRQLQREPTSEEIAAFRAEKGLDGSFLEQYISWITSAVQGDLGVSYSNSEPVLAVLIEYVPDTLVLAVSAMTVALVVALPLGVLGAVHRDTWIDYASQAVSTIGVAIPNFCVGYALILVFSIWLRMTPVSGSGSLNHLVLPALTLSTGIVAVVAQVVRTSVVETLDEEYVDAIRSKGVRERIVIYKHVLRNALIPVITIIGLQLGFVLNGAVVVEVVFQRPGLGALLVDAVFARNYPVIQGVVLLTALVFVLVNQLVDLAYELLDPRMRGTGL
ncbi:ABC transporter permease [Halococcus sp. IIIV-5B]|nr:ABC transporter permease [Halococcus sp. IIIV-5B]